MTKHEQGCENCWGPFRDRAVEEFGVPDIQDALGLPDIQDALGLHGAIAATRIKTNWRPWSSGPGGISS